LSIILDNTHPYSVQTIIRNRKLIFSGYANPALIDILPRYFLFFYINYQPGLGQKLKTSSKNSIPLKVMRFASPIFEHIFKL